MDSSPGLVTDSFLLWASLSVFETQFTHLQNGGDNSTHLFEVQRELKECKVIRTVPVPGKDNGSTCSVNDFSPA